MKRRTIRLRIANEFQCLGVRGLLILFFAVHVTGVAAQEDMDTINPEISGHSYHDEKMDLTAPDDWNITIDVLTVESTTLNGKIKKPYQYPEGWFFEKAGTS